jgi:hypothetical protein
LKIDGAGFVAVDYPQRDQFFAHKFVRLLHKAAIAAEIGRDAFSLLTVIAHTEDAMRYRGPAKFWNSQLIETLGFAKWETFDRARTKAIESGWLQYSGDGKRTAGEYFVTVPAGYEQITDSPIESQCTVVNPENGYEQGYKVGYEAGMIEGIKRGRSGVRSGDEQGEPSNPIPDPIPLPETQGDAVASSVSQVAEVKSRRKPAFVKPTVSEIIAYVIEIKATVDAKDFFRHYESNGWMVGRNPMRNWQMAVQQWNARNKKGGLYDNARKPGHSAAAREQANADAFAAFDAAVAAQSGRNAADDWRGSDTPLLT